jgi:alpha-aminoadipic semialdehyde synthase
MQFSALTNLNLSMKLQYTATNNLKEAMTLAQSRDKRRITVEYAEVGGTVSAPLRNILATGDVVVSLIPAALHVPIAQACIALKKHMITASYISPEMRELHEAAMEANVTILNEVGLDPGIDHLTAKQFMDEVQAAGGEITGFTSWCGGLPAPENSDNPLGYKFSWSPRGVLLAALNSAVYRKDGKEVRIPSENLLLSAQTVDIYQGFAFEGIANRDSLSYIHQYGLSPNINTMFRGTLRYKGYAHLVHQLRTLGLLSSKHLDSKLNGASWRDLMVSLLGCNSKGSVEDAIHQRTNLQAGELAHLINSMEWMGMLGDTPLLGATILDATCTQLQQKLVYAPGERDMVAMHHEFMFTTGGGKKSRHTSTLVTYGDPIPHGSSAMARTVGIPAAIATTLLLQGTLSGISGVIAPFSRSIYEPMLNALHKEKIVFAERTVDA